MWSEIKAIVSTKSASYKIILESSYPRAAKTHNSPYFREKHLSRSTTKIVQLYDQKPSAQNLQCTELHTSSF